MESSNLLAALAEIGVKPNNVALEYDDDNDCLCLVDRNGFENPDATPDGVMATFHDRRDPLAKWLVAQIQACVGESV